MLPLLPLTNPARRTTGMLAALGIVLPPNVNDPPLELEHVYVARSDHPTQAGRKIVFKCVAKQMTSSNPAVAEQMGWRVEVSHVEHPPGTSNEVKQNFRRLLSPEAKVSFGFGGKFNIIAHAGALPWPLLNDPDVRFDWLTDYGDDEEVRGVN